MENKHKLKIVKKNEEIKQFFIDDKEININGLEKILIDVGYTGGTFPKEKVTITFMEFESLEILNENSVSGIYSFDAIYEIAKKGAKEALMEIKGDEIMEDKITEERVREIVKEELNSFLEKVEQDVKKITTSLNKQLHGKHEA